MLIVHVHVRVKPESVADFRQATIENARCSVQEPGIARFDVMQQQDDATRFVLIEVYRTPEAPAAHRETAHYAKWRDTVAPMMAEPRQSMQYNAVFPDPRAGRSMRFEFATATRIVFGEGTAATLPELVRTFGVRPLVVTGASTSARHGLSRRFGGDLCGARRADGRTGPRGRAARAGSRLRCRDLVWRRQRH